MPEAYIDYSQTKGLVTTQTRCADGRAESNVDKFSNSSRNEVRVGAWRGLRR